MMSLRVRGLQMRVENATSVSAKEANVRHAIEAIHHCGPSDLIVLPELCTVGYGAPVFEQLSRLADDVDGQTLARFREAARKVRAHLALGFAERRGSVLFNSVAVISGEGDLVDVYRKAHLPQFADTMEQSYFTRGDRAVVFSVSGVKVGVMICYDVRFPELSRTLAFREGVDLLIHPTGFFKDETFASWLPFVVTRAIENQVYVLSVNRSGRHCGGSMFCPPLMDWRRHLKRLASKPDAIDALVDLRLLAKVREIYRYKEGRNPAFHCFQEPGNGSRTAR